MSRIPSRTYSSMRCKNAYGTNILKSHPTHRKCFTEWMSQWELISWHRRWPETCLPIYWGTEGIRVDFRRLIVFGFRLVWVAQKPPRQATLQTLLATLRIIAGRQAGSNRARGAKNIAVGAARAHIWQCPRPPHVLLCRCSAPRQLSTHSSGAAALLFVHCPNSSTADEKGILTCFVMRSPAVVTSWCSHGSI